MRLRTAEQDRAGLGVRAVLHEGEVLVAQLPDLKEPTAGADVRLLDLVEAVDDGGADRPGDPVVVGLADPADRGDAVLDEVVLRQVGDALLGDDNVGLDGLKTCRSYSWIASANQHPIRMGTE